MSELTRRDLLIGASAATLGSIGCSFASPLGQEPKPVGWAILGLGNYALGQIMPNMKHCKLSRPVALISGSPDKARRVAGEYGIPESKIYNYQNMERIADDPDIEVVYVITPPGTHAEFTIRSLKSGKHVCCEKPMAVSSKECQDMVQTAREAERRLQIGYRSHFEPHNIEAMRLCREGALGVLRTVRSEHGFVMNWDGGWHSNRALGGFGAISEIGVYSIQALCYLSGADPILITGSRHKLDVPRFREVEDVNHFNLIFPNGVQGIGATAYSWNANNFRVLATGGRLDAEPATGYDGHRFTVNGRAIQVEPANQFAAQMDHLSECVRDPNKTLIAPGEMGMRDIKIIEAILKSADEERAVRFA